MAVKSESPVNAAFLLGELPVDGSRKNCVVASGQDLAAGTVVGRTYLGAGRASVPTVVGTGNGTMTQVFAGPDVELGSYVVTVKTVVANGGVFGVVSPSGLALPDLTLTVGAGGTTVYRTSHINFSIVEGSTDFALADAFTIVVGTTAPVVVGTGNGTISGISLGPDAKPGLYRVENIEAITNGGVFKVVGPDGDQIATGSIVAGASGTLVLANQRQLNLTITEGSTDFAVGDFFNVAVHNIGNRGEGKVIAWAPQPATFEGSEDIAGILLSAVDATLADTPGILIVANAVIDVDQLTWAAAVSAEQRQTGYDEMRRNLGIMARE